MKPRYSKTVSACAASAVSVVLDTVSEHIDATQPALEAAVLEALRLSLAELAGKLKPGPPAKAAEKPTVASNLRPACRCKSQFCAQYRPKE